MGLISGYAIKLPHPSLRLLIRNYYTLRYTNDGGKDASQIILPNGFPEAMYIWGAGIVLTTTEGSTGKLAGGIAYGQLLRAQRIHFSDTASIYGVVFTPYGFHRLLTEDAGNICDRVTSTLDISHSEPRLFAWLGSRKAPPTLASFASRADAYFGAVSDVKRSEPPWLQSVIQQMFTSAGLAPVDYFRNISDVSERQFESKFLDFIGCRPKQFLMTLRFAKFLDRCESADEDVISIANECGFYDQAHLCHEVKRITGYTPLQYIKTKAELFGK